MRRLLVTVLVVGLIPVHLEAGQQVGGKIRVAVVDFEYGEVRESAAEVFGGEADVGQGIADLVAAELKKAGQFEVGSRGSLAVGSRLDYNSACALRSQLGVDVVITGGVLGFGKAEGEVAGVNVRVGRLAVGRIGRERSIALVALTAHVVGGEPCLPITSVASRATMEGSGTSLTGGVNLKVISAGGRMNLSDEEYQKTTIGKATTEAVAQLARELGGRYDEVKRALEAPKAAPPAAPAAPVAAEPIGPVGGPFVWGLYNFKGTEYFKYDAVVEEEGERRQGWYTLEASPVGEGRFRLTVAGQLGEESFRSTTTSAGQGIPLMQLAALGPAAVVLFSPMYGMLLGQEWALGNEWSFTSEGETVSFKVESECSYAGVQGLKGVWREGAQSRWEICASPQVALPLAVILQAEGGELYQFILVEYRP